MNIEKLNQLLEQYTSRRIAVVGDYFLDKYLEFDPDIAEKSIETGKTANQVVNVRHSPGAAGNVVANLAALRAGTIIPVGFCGDDGEGYDLRRDLADLGCSLDNMQIVPELMTPTYLKPRNIHLPLLDGECERFDTINRGILPEDVEIRLLESLENVITEIDAIIIIDQVEKNNRGTITERVRAKLLELARENPQVIFWVDSRNRIALYEDVIIKPNQFEAIRSALGITRDFVDEETLLDAGLVLSQKTNKPVFISRSELGMLVFDNEDIIRVDTVNINGPIDPTGAGDSATAGAVLSLASNSTLQDAALMANLAGSVAVRQIGITGTARPEQLREQYKIWSMQNNQP